MKGFWGYVKEQTNCRSGIGDLKNENDETITDDNEKAELLNKFFTSVFTLEGDSNIPVFDSKVDSSDSICEVNINPEATEILLKYFKSRWA